MDASNEYVDLINPLLRFVREAPTFPEVVAEKDGDSTLVQWVQDRPVEGQKGLM